MELSIVAHVFETHGDLLEAPPAFVLTTEDRGRGDLSTVRQKYRNLQGDLTCSLILIDPANELAGTLPTAAGEYRLPAGGRA